MAWVKSRDVWLSPLSFLISMWLMGTFTISIPRSTRAIRVLHGESNTSQASPRMTIQRMCQPQEAMQP